MPSLIPCFWLVTLVEIHIYWSFQHQFWTSSFNLKMDAACSFKPSVSSSSSTSRQNYSLYYFDVLTVPNTSQTIYLSWARINYVHDNCPRCTYVYIRTLHDTLPNFHLVTSLQRSQQSPKQQKAYCDGRATNVI
jgi:hypothetical protein